MASLLTPSPLSPPCCILHLSHQHQPHHQHLPQLPLAHSMSLSFFHSLALTLSFSFLNLPLSPCLLVFLCVSLLSPASFTLQTCHNPLLPLPNSRQTFRMACPVGPSHLFPGFAAGSSLSSTIPSPLFTKRSPNCSLCNMNTRVSSLLKTTSAPQRPWVLPYQAGSKLEDWDPDFLFGLQSSTNCHHLSTPYPRGPACSFYQISH